MISGTADCQSVLPVRCHFCVTHHKNVQNIPKNCKKVKEIINLQSIFVVFDELFRL